jgi:xanthine dehydrogenase large subunit
MDEPILADGSTDHCGQPIAVVLADTTRHAEAAAKVLEQDVEYTDHDDACVSLEEAMKLPEKKLPEAYLFLGSGYKRGDVAAGLTEAQHTLTGQVYLKEQKHFYMEPNVTYAIPDEDGCFQIHAATQYAGGTANAIAKCLGIAQNAVELKCRRVGGAFGGKLTRCCPAWSCV